MVLPPWLFCWADGKSVSFEDAANLAKEPAFNQRLTAAIVQAALQINGETQVPGHESWNRKRMDLARSVLAAPTAMVTRFSWAVAGDPTVSAGGFDSPTFDADVSAVVIAIWDDLAGVDPGEAPA